MGGAATYFLGPQAGSVAGAGTEYLLGTAVERNPKIFTNDNTKFLTEAAVCPTCAGYNLAKQGLKDPQHTVNHWKNEATKLEKKAGIPEKYSPVKFTEKVVKKITPPKEVIKKITPKISTPKVSCCKW